MTRPPKLQHWFIAQGVRALFSPAIMALNAQAAYWQTWHAVFREVRK